jgi:DNA-binding SARP family transcriptional activator
MPRRLLAATGFLVMLVGVPMTLLEFAGAPTFRSLPALDGVRRSIELRWVPVEWVIQILTLLAWALWAYLLLALLLRIAAHLEVRLRSVGSVWAASEAWTLSPVKLAVDFIVGATLLSATLGQGSARNAATRHDSGWAAALAPHVATLRSDTGASYELARDSMQPIHQSPSKANPRSLGNGSYIVRPGDSLWSIAEQRLNDPFRWTDIWQLNQGREMPGGQRLLRPGYIRPGWTLHLPERTGDDRLQRADEKHPKKATTEKLRDRQSPAGSDRPCPTTPAASPTERPAPHIDSDEKPAQRIELPSGTAVSLGFIGGFLTAAGIRELQRRLQRKHRSISRGWPKAEKRTDLKARLIRAIAANAEDVDQSEIEGARLLRADSAKIVLGHRGGSPVVAEGKGVIYTFTGNQEHVVSYMRNLALHILLSTRAAAEVWITDEVKLPPLSGLRVFADPRGLVSEMEVEILKRHRMFDEEGLKDWESHQQEWPDDPLPQVVGLVVHGADQLQNRLAAIGTQGQELGLLVFGQESAADAIHVEEDILQPRGRLEELLGEPFEAIRLSDADREELFRELAPRSQNDVLAEPRGALQTAPEPPGEVGSLIRVSLFGPPTIVLGDEELSGRLRRKSRELLTFFLLHPQGVGREQVIEALWPETEPGQATEKFWKQLGDMRRGLRSEAHPTAKFVDRSGDIYRVETDQFDVDVWRFDRLLAEGKQGIKSRESLAAAADLYPGELLEGIYYDWALPLRDHFRSQVIDVLVELAEVCEREEDLEEAARALTRAIDMEPYAEYLYRDLINIYGRLRRSIDIQRVYRELEAVLSEGVEAEPTGETTALKDRLIRELTPR